MTDDRSVAPTETTIDAPGGLRMRVAVALPEPAGTTGAPGVLVVHEAFGLTDFIRDVCARFAERGYAAIAPDLFSTGSRLACLTRMVRDHAHRTGATRTGQLLDVAQRHLAGQPGVDADRMAAIGFCMGGGFALAYGLTGTVRATSVNYGQVPAAPEEISGTCPVVGSFGADDPSLRGHGERLERYLADAGVPHDVRSYPGAGHGYLRHTPPRPAVRVLSAPLRRPMRLGYRDEATEDTWRRIFAFFDTHVRDAAPPDGANAG